MCRLAVIAFFLAFAHCKQNTLGFLTVGQTLLSVLRAQESEKTSERKIVKKKKTKKKERLEEEAEEEGGEEVEGGWEKVKGGAPMVKVKKS